MVQKQTALKDVSEEVISIIRGVVEVTIDEDGCQTVVQTGFRYPAHVDFADGRYDDNGNFFPRYWGWKKRPEAVEPFDGVVTDSRSCRAVFPLNPLPKAVVIPFRKGEGPGDWLEKQRELAELVKIAGGIA